VSEARSSTTLAISPGSPGPAGRDLAGPFVISEPARPWWPRTVTGPGTVTRVIPARFLLLSPQGGYRPRHYGLKPGQVRACADTCHNGHAGGLKIAGCFIAAVLIVSLVSRVSRAYELRATGVTFDGVPVVLGKVWSDRGAAKVSPEPAMGLGWG
jgi:hypothetical protein